MACGGSFISKFIFYVFSSSLTFHAVGIFFSPLFSFFYIYVL